MRLALILCALPLLGASPPPAPTSVPLARPHAALVDHRCPLLTDTGGKGDARFLRLGELPPAQPYAAMMRTDDKGCLDPLLYKDR